MSVFSDFNTSFANHPVKKDLSVKTDANAVKQSVRNLILTDRGERLMQPSVGSKIRSVLFENFSPQTVMLAKQYVKEVFDNYEPRAELLNVDVSPDPDNNAMLIGIEFAIINIEEPQTLNLQIERIG